MTPEKKERAKRNVYFCVGFSRFWSKPIHKIIGQLVKSFGLTWLRVRMSYHRFTNLREIFAGDLTSKLRRGIGSADFLCRPCNCCSSAHIDGKCPYNGICRRKCAVYKVQCKLCTAIYIGNTQQTVKTRMTQHFGDVRRLISEGKKSDTFAAHFAQHFDDAPSPAELREIMDFSIVAEVNPIGAVKTFGKMCCSLCMEERLTIVKASKKKGVELVNRCSEIYGACRHRTRFHRFIPACTDDPQEG